MYLLGIAGFERFFLQAAGLEMDKNDFRRFDDFVNNKVYDVLVRAVETARENGREVVEPRDLPVTAGLARSIHAAAALDGSVSVEAILEHLARRDALGLPLSDATLQRLPELTAGLAVALARSFRILDESLKTPTSIQWDKATRIVDLLV